MKKLNLDLSMKGNLCNYKEIGYYGNRSLFFYLTKKIKLKKNTMMQLKNLIKQFSIFKQ